MNIRDATDADLLAIVEIYNAAIPGRLATADTEPVSVEARAGWFREHDPGRRPLWVATVDEAIVGWLSFQSFYGRPAYSATAEVSVYVATAFQRGGIGRALLAKAIAESASLGLKTLVAFIFRHNEPSLRLFRSFGFEQWALLPGIAELDRVERDLLILGRRVRLGT
jgi:L-amino acid N-acyltransferase YncA